MLLLLQVPPVVIRNVAAAPTAIIAPAAKMQALTESHDFPFSTDVFAMRFPSYCSIVSSAIPSFVTLMNIRSNHCCSTFVLLCQSLFANFCSFYISFQIELNEHNSYELFINAYT